MSTLIKESVIFWFQAFTWLGESWLECMLIGSDFVHFVYDDEAKDLLAEIADSYDVVEEAKRKGSQVNDWNL